MDADKPKVLFQGQVKRSRYTKRFMWLLLASTAAVGAWVALREAAARAVADTQIFGVDVLDIGQLVALIILALLLLRLAVNLARALTVKNERVQIFKQGIVWDRGKKRHKYKWAQVKSFRYGVRTIELFGRNWGQRGRLIFTMRDGGVFRLTQRHGDLRKALKIVRPHIAEVTGTVMGRALRNGKGVRLHRRLALSPAGIIAGKNKIPWSEADVRVKRGRLEIRRLNDKGKFRTVRRYPTSKIENLGGFLEVADSTIRNHQPERFNITTRNQDALTFQQQQ